jgi:translation elongation factor EF-G
MVNDTRTAIERELGIEVVKREKVVSYRETVALRNKDRIPEAIAHIQSQIHQGKVTGKVTVNVNQGGVRTDVITEQNARIRLGSELDDLTDAAFFPEIVVDKESEVG